MPWVLECQDLPLREMGAVGTAVTAPSGGMGRSCSPLLARKQTLYDLHERRIAMAHRITEYRSPYPAADYRELHMAIIPGVLGDLPSQDQVIVNKLANRLCHEYPQVGQALAYEILALLGNFLDKELGNASL
jgi:hypothetical protein